MELLPLAIRSTASFVQCHTDNEKGVGSMNCQFQSDLPTLRTKACAHLEKCGSRLDTLQGVTNLILLLQREIAVLTEEVRLSRHSRGDSSAVRFDQEFHFSTCETKADYISLKNKLSDANYKKMLVRLCTFLSKCLYQHYVYYEKLNTLMDTFIDTINAAKINLIKANVSFCTYWCLCEFLRYKGMPNV